jgi:hypothetical protein
MTASIDELLAEEVLTFFPKSGTFDLETVASAISGIGYPYRDVIEPTAFAVFSNAEDRDECQNARIADPTSSFPYVLLVTVQPEEIVVYPISSHPELRAHSVQFLEWMLKTYDCRIENDYGTDISEPLPPKSEIGRAHV